MLVLAGLVSAAPTVEEINLDSNIEAIKNRAKAYEIVEKTSKEFMAALKEVSPADTPDAVMRKGVLVRAAIDEFTKALELFPKYATAHEELANCYFHLNTKETEKLEILHMKKARTLDPARIRVHLAIINTYLIRNEFDDAEEAARELMKIDERRGQQWVEEVDAMREVHAERNK